MAEERLRLMTDARDSRRTVTTLNGMRNVIAALASALLTNLLPQHTVELAGPCHKLSQLRQGVVRVHCLAATGGRVAVGATGRAQTGTVGLAQRLGRQRRDEVLAQGFVHLQGLPRVEREDQVVVRRRQRTAAAHVNAGHEVLSEVAGHAGLEHLKAARTG